MNDLVSVIMPCFNSEYFIKSSIVSVLNQTYKNLELIVIDDASSNKLAINEIMRDFMSVDKRVKFISLDKNIGVANARNEGIKVAQGRYIAFLDSDDLWKEKKLEVQIRFLNDLDLSFTYCSYELIDEKDNYLGLFITKPSITYNDFLKTCSVGCLSVIYDTKKIGKIYMPNVAKKEDYVTWLKILKIVGKTNGILEPLAKYRIHNGSVSSNKLQMAKYQWLVYTKDQKLGFFKSCYYFVQYAINGLLKYNIKGL